MLIRPEAPGDQQAVLDVVRSAFASEGDLVPDLVLALRDAGHGRGGLVAEDAGRVIGHVQLNRSWVDARERLLEVLVLCPLSVHPDHQRRGAGKALVAAALELAKTESAPALFLEGDPAYYGRLGFEPGTSHGFSSPSTRIPDPAFQVVVLPGHEAWMTGALVYCEPFWALDCVGLRDPQLAEVEHLGARPRL